MRMNIPYSLAYMSSVWVIPIHSSEQSIIPFYRQENKGLCQVFSASSELTDKEATEKTEVNPSPEPKLFMQPWRPTGLPSSKALTFVWLKHDRSSFK